MSILKHSLDQKAFHTFCSGVTAYCCSLIGFFLLYILCIVTLFVFVGRALQLNYCQFFGDPSKFEFLTNFSSLVASTTFFK